MMLVKIHFNHAITLSMGCRCGQHAGGESSEVALPLHDAASCEATRSYAKFESTYCITLPNVLLHMRKFDI